MKTQYYTASSLDEFIATEDDSLEWLFPLGDLTGQSLDADLLNELIIQIGSMTLGKGKQVFPRRALSPTLRLTAVKQMGIGMVEIRTAEGCADRNSQQFTDRGRSSG